MKTNVTRRSFLGFFLLGGLLSFFSKQVKAEPEIKRAMFWRKRNEA